MIQGEEIRRYRRYMLVVGIGLVTDIPLNKGSLIQQRRLKDGKANKYR